MTAHKRKFIADIQQNKCFIYSDDECTKVPTLPAAHLWLVILIFYGSVVLYVGIVHGPTVLPAAKNHSTSPTEFAEARARDTLDKLVGFENRVVGSHSNEILSKGLILEKAREIQEHVNSVHKIEIDEQNVSGTFAMRTFLGGMGQAYDNIKNVVVKLGPAIGANHSLLVNCHYDANIRSAGASDDAASCCVMLETLRAISRSSSAFKHNIIFLFNGGEESFFQASHGFITQHKWAKEIRVFLNLESAGSGGREFLFQTGPEHPWLVRAYMESATYPFTTVWGQEIFQTGFVQSDTDFRIFRDYGKIPGLDMAYISNGFVYHTAYDTPDKIPSGSLQRAGENLMSLLRTLGNSPLLPNPGADQHGKMVFFDVGSHFMVAYSQTIAIIINTVVSLTAMVWMWRKILDSEKSVVRGTAYLKLLSGATAAMLLTIVLEVIVSVTIATGMTLIGLPMSWYTHTFNMVILYVVPPFTASLMLHEYLKRTVYRGHNPWMMECVFFEAALLLWSVVTLCLTFVGVCSTYMMMLFVLMPLIVRGKLLSLINVNPKDQRLLFVSLHILGQAVPTFCCLYPLFSCLEVFIPILGRSGPFVPPDVILSLLLQIGVLPCTSYQVGLVYVSGGMKKVLRGLSAVMCVGVVMIILTPLGFPFRYTQENPTCQRHIFVHIDRVFHDATGQTIKADSGIFYMPHSYIGTRLIEKFAPKMRTGRPIPCEGPYCGMPYYIPIAQLIDPSAALYIPASALTVEPRAKFILASRTFPEKGVQRLAFRVTGPDHMTVYITPHKGVSMVRWSLTEEPPIITEMPSYCELNTYFIFYAYGEKPTRPWEFSIDLQVPDGHNKNASIVDVAVSGHYLHGRYGTTQDLDDLLKQLPDWSITTDFVSTYESYVL